MFLPATLSRISQTNFKPPAKRKTACSGLPYIKQQTIEAKKLKLQSGLQYHLHKLVAGAYYRYPAVVFGTRLQAGNNAGTAAAGYTLPVVFRHHCISSVLVQVADGAFYTAYFTQQFAAVFALLHAV